MKYFDSFFDVIPSPVADNNQNKNKNDSSKKTLFILICPTLPQLGPKANSEQKSYEDQQQMSDQKLDSDQRRIRTELLR